MEITIERVVVKKYKYAEVYKIIEIKGKDMDEDLKNGMMSKGLEIYDLTTKRKNSTITKLSFSYRDDAYSPDEDPTIIKYKKDRSYRVGGLYDEEEFEILIDRISHIKYWQEIYRKYEMVGVNWEGKFVLQIGSSDIGGNNEY